MAQLASGKIMLRILMYLTMPGSLGTLEASSPIFWGVLGSKTSNPGKVQYINTQNKLSIFLGTIKTTKGNAVQKITICFKNLVCKLKFLHSYFITQTSQNMKRLILFETLLIGLTDNIAHIACFDVTDTSQTFVMFCFIPQIFL